uniref:site-specific DNA-methyltransferase (adenine-specific) n=1 Tax=Candidatus Kentrum sp. SD TaxID=2126332 RepID=A0A451BJ76_9GAMM|nr:MAG: Methyltransferase domain-containing protein [Candidatus Kentron sp. SD]
MLRAHGQAVAYARALPTTEGRPPFIITLDVGVALEVYSEFTQSGGAYIPYPDPRAHRIKLADLQNDAIRQRLRAIWRDPLSLDPTRISAKVTRDIATRLAALARDLEQSGERSKQAGPARVAAFLMRCIFTMFAEDVGLIDNRAFTELLESFQDPAQFAPLVEELWQKMNTGGFSTAIRKKLLRFNGGLFADPSALTLDRNQINLLIDAARADWRSVEPAIFSTLLERALDPAERHKLGAHYTPRAYVERLVLPAVIEPLRAEWENAKTAAALLDQQGKHKKAVAAIRDFHIRLCGLRILDPACGSGNFLYVTLEHLKRLEGEILDVLEQLGEAQTLLEMQGVTVDPHQFLGIETNPRAAAIAEAVIWIGYLQWHFRAKGDIHPPEPVLREFKNIENRDAILAWARVETQRDEDGAPVTRWDGRTFKIHPVTGEQIPDEIARMAVERYIGPRKAQWPEADFVVGNPPFIGTARMRAALGDGYAEALRQTYPEVPESADLVMYWWHRAAGLARAGRLRRFGLITTNSLRQTFNRRVLQHHMDQKKPISLRYAVPDHPWVDAADGAQVRIAMTVAEVGELPGILETVITEEDAGGEGREVEIQRRAGKLFSDLKVGVDVAGCGSLKACMEISNPGVKLHGSGFIVTRQEAESLGLGRIPGLERHIREYRNGRDLTQSTRDVLVIDLFGLDADAVRDRFPEVYQWVLERVKPELDQNKRETRRRNWWLFGETNPKLRNQLANLPHYIATVETSKHRFFTFLEQTILPDNMLVNIALEDAFSLGVLSSRVHFRWANANGGSLGVYVGDIRYNKTRCFETFPFPDPLDDQKARIGDLAQRIDHHRKRQQAQHPGLTLTGIYNVLEKLRRIDHPRRAASENSHAAVTDNGKATATTEEAVANSRLADATREEASANSGVAMVDSGDPVATGEGKSPPIDRQWPPALGSATSHGDAMATGEPLTPKEKTIHEQGLVSVLRTLHDELDRAVFDAYGWGDLADRLVGRPGGATPWPEKPGDQTQAEEELLQRLLDLNHQRAAEEQKGIIRWLRPEYQNPQGVVADTTTQTEAALDIPAAAETDTATARIPWPKALPEQVKALRAALDRHPGPATPQHNWPEPSKTPKPSALRKYWIPWWPWDKRGRKGGGMRGRKENFFISAV